ncbi:MAG: phytanoyl-CoA dioxygenase family protein [Pseudomonadales bacterium]|nr:phytanoyl-CoA dioxygenase family protein [Pseudomonadales bacterium]MBL6814738.1 phytanoyl-CoA dioxygenase family protein [Pseudomonadales bacterium]
MSARYQQQQIESWHEDGAVVVPNFFTPDEIAPIYDDYARLYGFEGAGNGNPLAIDTGQPAGAFHPKQFKNLDTLPYDGSVEMNLISLHPSLIQLASELLGNQPVQLYQSHTWAKFTGEADYDQPFHCDYGNHTLTVPGEDVAQRTVNFVIYLSDVTDALGAMHYVKKSDSDAILGSRAIAAPTEYQVALKARQHSAAAPAGSIIAYGIDTFHRGTNMTEPNGLRYTMTVSFKRADNANIGFHVWQHALERPWHLLLNHATPTQLECLGIPAPGNAFWTDLTLRQCQQRWPEWNMSEYVLALAGASPDAANHAD